jgi:MFS family permease
MSEKRLPFHYGWLIVVAGMLGVLAALGFGRFALGMLLPSMALSLDLTYSQMGFISTGNFVGYLAAVLVSGFWAMQIGARKLIFIALLLVGVTMVLSSFASGFVYLLIVYTLTGMGSGASNVPIMSLVSSWFGSRARGRAAGFIVIGSGFAIIFTGRFIPFINDVYGAEGWRTGWLCLGLAVTVIAFVCYAVIRDKPAEKGLEPLSGGDTPKAQGQATASKDVSVYRSLPIYHLGALYFLFGYTYVIYATFIVTTLVKERGFSEAAAGGLWSLVGLLSLFSGPVFGTLSDRLGRKAGLMIVFAFHMMSYGLIASGLAGPFLYLSIGLFGLVAWSIPSIMAAAVGDYVLPLKAAAAFGFITFIFGLGQITGPAIAGVVAEQTGSFSLSFLMASLLAGTAVLLAGFLPKP